MKNKDKILEIIKTLNTIGFNCSIDFINKLDHQVIKNYANKTLIKRRTNTEQRNKTFKNNQEQQKHIFSFLFSCFAHVVP